MKNLVLRTITGILFVAIVVASFAFYETNPVFFFFVFLLFTAVGTFELLRMANAIDLHPNSSIAMLMSVLVFALPPLAAVMLPLEMMRIFILLCAIILLLFPITAAVELFTNSKTPLSNVAITALPMIWVAVPFALTGFWLEQREINLAISVFVVIWLSDTLAYCSGRLFGKHKLFERISPKKTIEGFAISLVLTMGLSMTLHYFLPVAAFSTPWHWCGFALVVIIFGTLGDLVESMFKRSCNIKDSGKLLPGHGGVLDRFDSSFLAIPAAFLYWLSVSLF